MVTPNATAMPSRFFVPGCGIGTVPLLSASVRDIACAADSHSPKSLGHAHIRLFLSPTADVRADNYSINYLFLLIKIFGLEVAMDYARRLVARAL